MVLETEVIQVVFHSNVYIYFLIPMLLKMCLIRAKSWSVWVWVCGWVGGYVDACGCHCLGSSMTPHIFGVATVCSTKGWEILHVLYVPYVLVQYRSDARCKARVIYVCWPGEANALVHWGKYILYIVKWVYTRRQTSSLEKANAFALYLASDLQVLYNTYVWYMYMLSLQGTLPGILISLYHLDNSELTLKSLHYKTG